MFDIDQVIQFPNPATLAQLLRLKSTLSPDQPVSLDEYVERISKSQSNIYYVVHEPSVNLAGNPMFNAFMDRGIVVLLVVNPLDRLAISQIHHHKGKLVVNISDLMGPTLGSRTPMPSTTYNASTLIQPGRHLTRHTSPSILQNSSQAQASRILPHSSPPAQPQWATGKVAENSTLRKSKKAELLSSPNLETQGPDDMDEMSDEEEDLSWTTGPVSPKRAAQRRYQKNWRDKKKAKALEAAKGVKTEHDSTPELSSSPTKLPTQQITTNKPNDQAQQATPASSTTVNQPGPSRLAIGHPSTQTGFAQTPTNAIPPLRLPNPAYQGHTSTQQLSTAKAIPPSQTTPNQHPAGTITARAPSGTSATLNDAAAAAAASGPSTASTVAGAAGALYGGKPSLKRSHAEILVEKAMQNALAIGGAKRPREG